MVTEEFMREALEGLFTTYVGNPNYDEKRVLKRELLRQQQELRQKRLNESRQAKIDRELETARRLSAQANEPDYRHIIACVAKAHGIPMEDIFGPSRVYPVKTARHHAIWELKKRKPSWAKIKIGLVLNRDHTTALNSLQYVAKHPSEFARYMETVERLLTESPK